MAKIEAQLPTEERQILKKIHATCQSDPTTKVDKEKLKHMEQYIDDLQLGAHLRCMGIKLGCINEQGVLNKEVVRSKIALVTPKSKVEAILEKCAVQRDTPEKTAVLLVFCFYQNGVQYHPAI